MIRLVPSGKKDGHGNKPDSGREVAPCVGFIPSIMNQRVNCCNQAIALIDPVTGVLSVIGSRVENRRSGFSLPVAVGVLSHDPPQSGLA
jgi:hypothetical protein